MAGRGKPTEAGGIPRYRETALPALFSQGFRPFFLGAAVWAPAAMVLWILQLAGCLDLPIAFDPPAWHAHELIFGFAQAAMAGFLMTSVPNWTGRMPLQGVPLLVLAATWATGRAAMAVSALIGEFPTAFIDLLFPTLLLAALGREILAGRNWRNLPMMAALALMLVANLSTHLAAAGLTADKTFGARVGIAVLGAMISLVGGRLIPSFTRNRLARMGASTRPAPFGSLDRLALAVVPLALAAWAFGLASSVTGPLLVLAAALAAARLARWHGWRTTGDASLWPLHAGYGWLALGLALLGASELQPTLSPMAGLHALTIGAIGTTILAVMGRATFSQTSRRTAEPRAAGAIAISVAVSAVSRILASLLSDLHEPLLWLAALAWIAAFVLFIVSHGRALLAPKGRNTEAPAPR